MATLALILIDSPVSDLVKTLAWRSIVTDIPSYAAPMEGTLSIWRPWVTVRSVVFRVTVCLL